MEQFYSEKQIPYDPEFVETVFNHSSGFWETAIIVIRQLKTDELIFPQPLSEETFWSLQLLYTTLKSTGFFRNCRGEVIVLEAEKESPVWSGLYKDLGLSYERIQSLDEYALHRSWGTVENFIRIIRMISFLGPLWDDLSRLRGDWDEMATALGF